MKEGFIPSGSANIHYEIHGEENSEVLVLIHGNSGNLHYFDEQINYFKKDYKILALDSRGHGESTFGKGNLSLTVMADDLYNIIMSFGFYPFNLLGFSDGASIAMYFALKHCPLIKKLILYGGNINPWGVKLSFQLPVFISYQINRFASYLNPQMANLNREYLGLMVNEPYIPEEDLKKITAETLVIVGSKDLIRKSHTKKIFDNLPNAKMTVIQGGDHFCSKKMPEKFNPEVEKFLKMS
ncbi:MAG: alpha/beta hydrolase [Clostridiales bacterium]|nr:alpha/beta hydrolase [Clostridiales bacterium]